MKKVIYVLFLAVCLFTLPVNMCFAGNFCGKCFHGDDSDYETDSVYLVSEDDSDKTSDYSLNSNDEAEEDYEPDLTQIDDSLVDDELYFQPLEHFKDRTSFVKSRIADKKKKDLRERSFKRPTKRQKFRKRQAHKNSIYTKINSRNKRRK